MHHPYIAGLIDGGTTGQGAPYLVMELIDGMPIDEYCDQNRLSIDERLLLLEKVTAALQYAHQNQTIHRDVKPSNVLVTSDGIPKLVDFGIAKLLTNPAQGDSGATTLFGNHMFTPDYASPEQVLTGKVSISSDIYSIGTLAIKFHHTAGEHTTAENRCTTERRADSNFPRYDSPTIKTCTAW